MKLHHAQRVDTCLGDVEIVAVGAQREADRLYTSQRPIGSTKQRQTNAISLDVAVRVEDRDAVVVAVRDVDRMRTDHDGVRMTAAVNGKAVARTAVLHVGAASA